MWRVVVVVLSRVVTVLALVGFWAALAGDGIPHLASGGATFAVLWVLGLAMHKLSEARDYRGRPRRYQGSRWSFVVLAVAGVAALALPVAVLAGVDARTATAVLAVIVVGKCALTWGCRPRTRHGAVQAG